MAFQWKVLLALLVCCLLAETVLAQDCNNLSLVLSTREPEPGHVVGITVTSAATGMRLSGESLRVYDTKTMETLTAKTNSQGWFQYRPQHPGTYRVIPQALRWCSAEFTVKKRMLEVGDEKDLVWPDKYRYETGEPITFSVPPAVGVKIVREDGSLWRTLSVSRAGFGNVSIDEPGTYALVVGEVSTEFWGRNRSFEVAAAPRLPTPPSNESTSDASTTSSLSTTSSVADSSTSSSLHVPGTSPGMPENHSGGNKSAGDAPSSSLGSSLLRMALVALVVFLLGLVAMAVWVAHRTYRAARPSGKAAKGGGRAPNPGKKTVGGPSRGSYRRYRPRR